MSKRLLALLSQPAVTAVPLGVACTAGFTAANGSTPIGALREWSSGERVPPASSRAAFHGVHLGSHVRSSRALFNSRRALQPPPLTAAACRRLPAAGWQFKVSRMAPAAAEPPADEQQSAEPQQLKQLQQPQALRSFTLRIR